MTGPPMNHCDKRTWFFRSTLICLAALFALSGPDAPADPPAGKQQPAVAGEQVAARLAVIARTGPQGAGSAAARRARDDLARRGVEILPQLLAAMDTSNVVAANWYRTIYEDIVVRALSRSDVAWPREFMNEYVSDAGRAGRPRRLVLALLDRLEPEFSEKWLPTRLEDSEFRYEAVARALAAGDAALRDKNAEAAKSEFRKAF